MRQPRTLEDGSVVGQRASDKTGKVFGRLTVIRVSPQRCSTGLAWECMCSCGNLITVGACNLATGGTRSCGCLSPVEKLSPWGKHGHRRLELEDKRFGKLVVVGDTGKQGRAGIRIWKCRCDCGQLRDVTSENLNNGKTVSCIVCGKESLHKSIQDFQKKERAEKFAFEGRTFGWLKVLREHPERDPYHGGRQWECICLCGNVKIASTSSIAHGGLKSCGCMKRATRHKVYQMTCKKYGIVGHLRPAKLGGSALKYRPQRNESGYRPR